MFTRVIQPYDVRTAVDRRAILPAEQFDRRITRISITGPQGSKVEIFLNNESPSSRVDQTAKGSSNTAEYPNPLFVPQGTSVIVRWSLPGDASATFAVTA